MTVECICGETAASMDAFVDHVSDDHDALSIAVETLREDAPEGEL
jgi:hypothetical protein